MSVWLLPAVQSDDLDQVAAPGELPRALASDHHLFVETNDAFELPPVGCAELSHLAGTCGTVRGDVVNDPAEGRASDSEITVYKAMGVAMEDMVAANLAYRSARRAAAGALMQW